MTNFSLSKVKGSEKIFNILFVLYLFCIAVAVYYEQYLLLILPTAVLLSIFFIRDLKLAYYLMIMSIPISIEYYFGSLSLDAPVRLEAAD